jgi:hypothetical protein
MNTRGRADRGTRWHASHHIVILFLANSPFTRAMGKHAFHCVPTPFLGSLLEKEP